MHRAGARVLMTFKILVADDDQDNRDLLAFVFERSGMNLHLVTVVDGQQAIDIARDLHPHLILMDMNMGGMDGWTAVKHLKADIDTKDIPIIAFTAFSSSEDRERAIQIGCSEFYAKPMDPEEVLALIRQFLSV